MDTRMIYLPTGQIFDNRKEAKTLLGHSMFNRAMKSRDLVAIEKINPVTHLQDYDDEIDNQTT